MKRAVRAYYIELPEQLKAVGLPQPEREYRFHPERKWRFDYAFPALRLAVEVEGGFFARKGSKKCPACGLLPPGRHSTGAGQRADLEKYNAATVLGWRLIRVMPDQLKSGEALTTIEAAIHALTTAIPPTPVQGRLEL